MAELHFETWDVFTDTRYAGNPLAIVYGADELSTEAMQTIAREFNLSETSFVMAPRDPAHAARVRIFTPAYEMPFAGHPTVGTAIAIGVARDLGPAFTLELNAGLFPIQFEARNDASFARFENPNLPAETGAAPSAAALEAAFSLPRGSIDHEAGRPRRIGAGVDFIYAKAPLADVVAARLDAGAFAALGLDDVVGVLLYAEGGFSEDAAFHARMFAPNAGVPEDPATGSACAALPGCLAAAGALADGTHDWIVEQGFEMGRPSRIELTIDAKEGVASRVAVGGCAVPVTSGTLHV